MSPLTPLRIAVVQFAPQIGRVQANLAKARALCAKLEPRSVDLVCLPEMILTGYVFPSSSAIAPHLELPKTGTTSLFCAELAKRLSCYVFAGYPECLQPHEVTKGFDNNGSEVDLIGANSAIIYGPNGNWIGGYRKTNLYETDRTWAIPGTGFATFSLPPPLGTVCLGICMDLNTAPPAVWDSVQGPYELADHCLSKDANILIMLNAWLDSGRDLEEKQDWNTMKFWAARLLPLWAKPTHESTIDPTGNHENSDQNLPPINTTGDNNDKTLVVICNRSGQENGITFAGTSAAFIFERGSGRPTLLHVMDRSSEEVCVWNI